MGGNIIDITAFSPPTVQPVIKYRRIVSLKMGGGVRNTPLVSQQHQGRNMWNSGLAG